MAVMGSRLAVAYRYESGTPGVLFYDFSPGIEASGAEELIDPQSKRPYIWSPPHLYNPSLSGFIGAMGSIRNASGRKDFICLEANAGSTGDGRYDLINTGSDDNGAAFVANAVPAPIVATAFMSLTPQRCEVTHRTTTGAASILYFANDQTPTFNTGGQYLRTLPVSASKTRFQKQTVPIDQGQRGKTDMFWMQWRAPTTGVSSTRLYRIVLQYGEVETA
jgi:hypothetical protein